MASWYKEDSDTDAQEIAREEQQPMQAVLARALEAYRRERFLREANAEYEVLRNNPEAWAEELKERELFEGTLADGLEDE